MVGGTRSRAGRALALAGGLIVLLTGCSSMQRPEVEDVATTFDDPTGDAEARCDLLAPATLATFEEDQTSSCPDAIEQLSLDGGAVTSVEIWGGDAQVRMSGDTVFLTETSAGWRVAAAGCQPQGEAPYDCEVEGP
jgi:hypothetical protein